MRVAWGEPGGMVAVEVRQEVTDALAPLSASAEYKKKHETEETEPTRGGVAALPIQQKMVARLRPCN